MSPLVSIVLPCYNGEAYVESAIDSALAQTYSEVEIIVVDDGSTDSSWDRIRSYGTHVRAVTGPNQGGCAARNRGIEMSRGGWVQFLDADDLLYPTKLAEQMPLAIEAQDSPTYCDHFCRGVDPEAPPELRGYADTAIDPFLFVLRHRTLTMMGPVYRKQWLNAVGGFRVGMAASQEFDLNLRLALRVWGPRNSFVHLPRPLFEVRRQPYSISSNSARTFAAAVESLEEIAQELAGVGSSGNERRQELAVYTAWIGRQCLRGGEARAGVRLVDIADRMDRRAAEAAVWGTGARWVKRILGCRAAERVASWRFNKPTGRKERNKHGTRD